MFKRVLVANRGEIAVRIMRSCREMGVETVAVYSDADAQAQHVLAADQALHIGASVPAESYLNVEAIIDACKSSRAEALHPGYGFLSEQPAIARACAEAGITFIGPPPEAMELLGSKTASRVLAAEHQVPLAPGSKALDWTKASLTEEAERIGFPVMIKAAAGGGGKGMRIVAAAETLWADYEAARREAIAAFGDGTVYLEKVIEGARHVEIQILADHHGHCIYLGERECSIQRRHQKIIEETPSPALDDELRQRMGQAAVALAQAAGYQNAGTVEFMLDAEKNYFFLEMNARLQVEHPVTEMVTGLDLVRHQLCIAAGEPLALTQADVRPRGHAIEVRIYAEDPAKGFLPSPGTIRVLREPSGPGVRCDSGVRQGAQVPLEYDPILAKLVVHAEDREAARARMLRALEDYVVLGVETPIAFLREVLEHPAFVGGELRNDFVDRHFAGWTPRSALVTEALLAAVLFEQVRPRAQVTGGEDSSGPATAWQTLGAWHLGARS